MNEFVFSKVTSKETLEDVFRLRYKVYCDEWKFERPEDHPGGLEFDGLDAHSVHFAAFRKGTTDLIGTIRIIRNSEMGFPIERHFTIEKDLSSIDKDKIGEISRLAVSKDFRRRATDRLIYNGGNIRTRDHLKSIEERRKNENEIVLGLYTTMYLESAANGLTHWYAVMARGLYILLKRVGIVFTPIGPEKDYHGMRRPYIGNIASIVKSFSRANPEFFEEMVVKSRQESLALKR
jgi:N-acyl amino acid synthase of PEP-CTERM/exosortase system